MPNRGRQTAVLGKAKVAVVPKAIVVKPGCAAQRVPLAIMGVTAEISDLEEESAHRDERIVQGARQISQDPARSPIEHLFQLFSGDELGRHRR